MLVMQDVPCLPFPVKLKHSRQAPSLYRNSSHGTHGPMKSGLVPFSENLGMSKLCYCSAYEFPPNSKTLLYICTFVLFT